MPDYYEPTDCVICPRKADGQRTTHRWASLSTRDHLTTTAIVRAGKLEDMWWGLSKGMRLKLVAAAERDIGQDLSHLRDLIEQDGPARNFAFRYAMTGGRSQIDRLGGFPPVLADKLAQWAKSTQRK